MLTRRALITQAMEELALYAILGRSEGTLQGRVIEVKPESCVWVFDPPGTLLRRFCEELADDITGSREWRQEPYVDDLSGWYLAWVGCGRRPLVFDDLPYRGDGWMSAEDRLQRVANWARVKLELVK